jgi:hypothetical protein
LKAIHPWCYLHHDNGFSTLRSTDKIEFFCDEHTPAEKDKSQKASSSSTSAGSQRSTTPNRTNNVSSITQIPRNNKVEDYLREKGCSDKLIAFFVFKDYPSVSNFKGVIDSLNRNKHYNKLSDEFIQWADNDYDTKDISMIIALIQDEI